MEESRGRKGSDNTWERARALSETGLKTWLHRKKSGSMDRIRQSSVLESGIFCSCVLIRGNTPGADGFHDEIIRKGKERVQDSVMRLANSQKRKQGKIWWRGVCATMLNIRECLRCSFLRVKRGLLLGLRGLDE